MSASSPVLPRRRFTKLGTKSLTKSQTRIKSKSLENFVPEYIDLDERFMAIAQWRVIFDKNTGEVFGTVMGTGEIDLNEQDVKFGVKKFQLPFFEKNHMTLNSRVNVCRSL